MRISRWVLALCLAISLQAQADQKVTYKVAVLEYMQETCTFCPGGDTTIADRTRQVPFVSGEDLVSRTGGFVGGFMHTAAQFDEVVVVLDAPRPMTPWRLAGAAVRGSIELARMHRRMRD